MINGSCICNALLDSCILQGLGDASGQAPGKRAARGFYGFIFEKVVMEAYFQRRTVPAELFQMVFHRAGCIIVWHRGERFIVRDMDERERFQGRP
jgi:hypothetical protein